jgi:predicted transposase YbfD/YdcC
VTARLVLAQQKVAGKSNKITAIPKLLYLLDLGGYLVMIDTMGIKKQLQNK